MTVPQLIVGQEARGLKYDAGMRLAALATLPLFIWMPLAAAQTPAPAAPPKPAPAAPKPAPTQRPRAATAAAPTTATVTVTDPTGAALADVRVNLTGVLDRSGSTQSDGTVRFDGLRPGTYRLRFTKEGFTTFEREIEVRAGQPAPTPAVTLTPAPEAPKPPPPAPDPPKATALPPPGKAMTLSVPDFIEKNFITNSQPQKVSAVACSGVANTVLWQIREPWTDRQHAGADALLYVVGGEGTLRLEGRDSALAAGSFATVPRGMTYSLTRRGRNPLIVLATLAGEPCQ
jgi:mannose-6-phosphate isomerase-like protein (cupin superfamily)